MKVHQVRIYCRVFIHAPIDCKCQDRLVSLNFGRFHYWMSESSIFSILFIKSSHLLSKSRNVTNSIFKKVKEETSIVGWKTKTSSEKKLSIAIYDMVLLS
jgi:hypothetical protein